MITIIVKPTLDCNLNCGYCYFKETRSREKMSLETCENLMRNLQGKQVSFIWHGGEPMLMGIEFYWEAIALQRKYGIVAENSMQTNLTLMKGDWMDFFRESGFSVSTSLDGVKEVHDQSRSNSYEKVVSNIHRLRKAGFKVGAVAVLTEQSLPYLYDNFKLYHDLGISVRVNPENACVGNPNAADTAAKAYEFAMKFYYDLWLGLREKNIRINPTHEIQEFLIHGKRNACIFMENCVGKYFSILPDGEVCHCGRFAGTGFAVFGNINDLAFSFTNNLEIKRIHAINQVRVAQCSSCTEYSICHAGCFYHGWLNGIGKDNFCEAYKNIFQHIRSKLKCNNAIPQKNNRLLIQPVSDIISSFLGAAR